MKSYSTPEVATQDIARFHHRNRPSEQDCDFISSQGRSRRRYYRNHKVPRLHHRHRHTTTLISFQEYMPEVSYARSNVILTLVPSSQSLEACVSKDQHEGNLMSY